MGFRSRRARLFNRNATEWLQEGRLSREALIKRYEGGAAGCWMDDEAHEQFREVAKKTGGYSDFGDAANAKGYADAYAGKLVLPFIQAVELFPGCFPGAAQERGDCEAHQMRTTGFMTMVGDITRAVVDEVTGEFEAPPEISEQARRDLVLACEYNWWLRGYNGDGWYIDDAFMKAIKYGFALRQPYPEFGFDLTEYSYANSAKYGRTPPPQKVLEMGQLHLISSGADINSFAEFRDAQGNGFGVGSDGGEGFGAVRDQYGISRRRGGWSHSFPHLGADDRPETIQKFGEPLALNCNNWGQWNSGPRDIYDSAKFVPPAKKALWIKLDLVNPDTGNIMIPPGCWWCPWSDIKNRQFKAAAGFRGWARKALPDYGFTAI